MLSIKRLKVKTWFLLNCIK